MKIFLSHRSRDKALVREFKGLLPGFLESWIDEDSLTWGEAIPGELKRTIQSGVDFLIIFLDKDAFASRWVSQELRWAVDRERELKRPFVLPILLEAVAPEDLPPEMSGRLFLRLADYSHASVEDLAKRASMKLFQLVVQSYSALQLEIPRRESLLSVRDALSSGQARLLGYLADEFKADGEVTQRRVEQGMGRPEASAELFYRLESLIQQGFLAKRRIATDGQFSYRLSDEFRDLLERP